MASMRDIKRRIKSVGSTQKITKAMNLVAASKLQRARAKLEDTRHFFGETRRVIGTIVAGSEGISHPLLDQRIATKTLVILITSDIGLCGGYNANISKEAGNLAKSKPNVSFITIGGKGKEYCKRNNFNTIKEFVDISEKPSYEDAAEIGAIALNSFLKYEADEVFLAYTEFKSTLTHIPKAIRLLPVDATEFKNDGGPMNYEPDPETVLSFVIPKYVNTVIFGALVESSACEQGARMTSMDSATENADEMIDDLTLLFNRARQGAITQEITEIVGGANALE